MPVRLVKCEACGRQLERKTYWRHPRCGPADGQACYAKRAAGMRRDEKAERRRTREQARRYRVLATLLAWPEEDFERNARLLSRDPGELRFYVADLLKTSRDGKAFGMAA